MNQYSATRLLFRRSVIEALSLDESFQIVSPQGTFRFTRQEFEAEFPNVVNSKAYQVGGVYHYRSAGCCRTGIQIRSKSATESPDSTRLSHKKTV